MALLFLIKPPSHLFTFSMKWTEFGAVSVSNHQKYLQAFNGS
jgi:hypothetical protein